jgi:hypothetical protein
MQVVLSYSINSYSIFSESDVSLSYFSDQVTSKTGVPRESQRLIINGRQLSSEVEFAELIDVHQTNFVQLQLRLLGGKGGFGALLRTSKGTKKTTNFGACRDLNGRRLKDIQLEQKLQEIEAKKDSTENEKNSTKVAKEIDPTPKVDNKKEVLDREIREQRNEILQNVNSAMDQGFAIVKEKKKVSKEKKRKREEVKLPDDLWDNFGLVQSEDEGEESDGEKKKKKLNEVENNVEK